MSTPKNSNELYEAFLALDQSFHSPPRMYPGGEQAYSQQKRLFIRGNVHLYHLAQAICCIHARELQVELDEARREVMHELTNTPRGIAVQLRPQVGPPPRWADYEITPEVSFDLGLTGNVISRRAAQRLLRAHKQQVSTVMKLVADYRRIQNAKR